MTVQSARSPLGRVQAPPLGRMSTVKELRELIEDPKVRTVRIADVTYEVGGY